MVKYKTHQDDGIDIRFWLLKSGIKKEYGYIYIYISKLVEMLLPGDGYFNWS